MNQSVFELRVLFRWKQDGEPKTVGSDFKDKKPANNVYVEASQ